MDNIEMQNEQEDNQMEISQQEASYDYSQPLFERSRVSILSFLSAIIFVVVGVLEIFARATAYPIIIGIVLLCLGVVLLLRNILAMRGIKLFGR